jgi:ATP-dependent DNA helicase RecG
MVSKKAILLSTPIEEARGVGEARAKALAALEIKTCGDLLNYLPRDYLHFTDEAPVAGMKVGEMATIRGTILQTRMHGSMHARARGWGRGKSRLEALLEDSSGTEGGRCVLTWFNPFGLQEKLLPGTMVRVTGKVTQFRGRFQIVQGKVEVLNEKDAEMLAPKAARVEPVYPATADLPSPVIWRILKGMLDDLVAQVEEWFAPEFLAERNLLTRQEAMRRIHAPASLQDAILAKRTLAYHEFFLHQSAFAIKRFHQRHGTPAVPLRVDDAVDAHIRALLPFAFTGAQKRVIEAIRKDLAGTKPMNRLLQGDVGSGKTVVALYAMLAACATPRVNYGEIENRKLKNEKGFEGHQAALMAPTEILAEQHFITLSNLLAGRKVKIALLTGSVTGAERREVLGGIANGSVGIVVGTHALLGEEVNFKSLAMVVIDEQHKFGVEHRSRIRTKPAVAGLTPHILVMTATPIPRTLAMTAFGDLDVSVIDELPPGRQPIFTRMTPGSNREEVYHWLARQVGAHEQAYVVVPAIDPDAPMEEELELAEDPVVAEGADAAPPPKQGHGEAANNEDVAGDGSEERVVTVAPEIRRARLENLRNAVSVQRELQAEWLKDARVGILHGRMARETRQHIMERFRQRLIDVLVSTTVIEVGVDVPNASIMIVENADRFGLSQLHQLRGRVGRGSKQSYCVLLGDLTTDAGVARLQAMVKFTSGFHIADADLKLRGMGQLIGYAQSGRTDIHFAELLFDPVLLPLSRRDAFSLISADPRLLDASHVNLREAVLKRFADTITLADVG